MKISVIIPTKDEPLIQKLVDEVNHVLENYDHEIIVVDESEKPPELNGAKLVVQESSGLGKAVLEGVGQSTGGIIITMDGDFSHRPIDVPKLIDKTNTADIVIGSRFIENGKTNDQTHRKLISYVYRKIASKILNINVEDNMSGFVAVRREVYDSVELNPIGYKINLELMYKAMRNGFRIAEVPIVFEQRRSGKSKADWTEALRILRYVIELKLGKR